MFALFKNTKHWAKFFPIHYHFSSFPPLEKVDSIYLPHHPPDGGMEAQGALLKLQLLNGRIGI